VGNLTSQAMDSNGQINSNFEDNRAVPSHFIYLQCEGMGADNLQSLSPEQDNRRRKVRTNGVFHELMEPRGTALLINESV